MYNDCQKGQEIFNFSSYMLIKGKYSLDNEDDVKLEKNSPKYFVAMVKGVLRVNLEYFNCSSELI